MRHHLQEAARLGWGGARANLLPAVALWAVGVTLILAYDKFPPLTFFLDQVGEWKVAWTPWFAILSTALFGALIPAMIQRLFAPNSIPFSGIQITILALAWAIQGWEIDLLYRTQAHFFGNGTDPATIAKKTLVDQFVWCPFLGLPQTVLGYLYAEKKGSFSALRIALRRKSFLQRAIPLLITTWVVWIPAVSLIYLFPPSLQLPLMNIILAIWSLILTFFARNTD